MIVISKIALENMCIYRQALVANDSNSCASKKTKSQSVERALFLGENYLCNWRLLRSFQRLGD